MNNVARPIALPAFTQDERINEICSQLWHCGKLNLNQRILVMDCWTSNHHGRDIAWTAILQLLALASVKGVRL